MAFLVYCMISNMGLLVMMGANENLARLVQLQFLLFFAGPKRILALLKYPQEDGNKLSAIYNRQILKEIRKSSWASQQMW